MVECATGKRFFYTFGQLTSYYYWWNSIVDIEKSILNAEKIMKTMKNNKLQMIIKIIVLFWMYILTKFEINMKCLLCNIINFSPIKQNFAIHFSTFSDSIHYIKNFHIQGSWILVADLAYFCGIKFVINLTHSSKIS